jgi:putative addiction module component (TIGR02574 family)
MPMTLDQIFLETQQWPTEQVAELVDRLILELPSTPEIEAAWKVEARRRIADIESGRVTGVPGELVSARIREIVGR